MADTPTSAPAPAAPAPATPENSPPPQSSGGQPPAGQGAKPTPSEAGKTLNELRHARREKLREGKDKPAPKAEAPTTASTAEKPSTKDGGTSASGDGKESGTTPATEKPTPSGTDDEGKQLAALIKHEQRLKTREKELETKAERFKALETLAPAIDAAKAKAEAGDRVGAIRDIFGSEFTKEALWDLLKQAEDLEKDEGKAPDVKATIREELEARQKAEQAEAERKRKERDQGVSQRLAKVDAETGQPGFSRLVAEIETLAPYFAPAKGEEPGEAQARTAGIVETLGLYVRDCARTLVASKAKYPAVAEFDVSPLQVIQAAEKLRKANNRVATWEETLQALEDGFKARALRIAGVQAKAPEPSPTVDSTWRQDLGKPSPQGDGPKTLDDIRAARKGKLKRPAA